MDVERGLVRTSEGYIHYRATGSGRPIVLMHAVPKSSTSQLELMEVLGRGLRVFALDTLGYGMSDHPSHRLDMSDYTRAVMEAMAGLGILQASFLGDAMGAYMAVDLANSYPERVDKIILVNCPIYPGELRSARHGKESPLRVSYRYDPTGFPQPRTVQEALEKDPEHCPMKLAQSVIDRDNVALAEAGRELWHGLEDAVDTYPLPSKLEGVACPALGMWGEHFYFAQYRNEFADRMKDIQMKVIEGARFMPYIDRPEQVGRAVLEFLT